MSETLSINLNEIYSAWRTYLLSHSGAKNFGMINDGTVAKFPYANLMLLGNATNISDMSGDECTWTLTFQTDCYIDNTKIDSVLYPMDEACRIFFVKLGFRKMGDSPLITSNGITRITSRFTMSHYNGILENLSTINDG